MAECAIETAGESRPGKALNKQVGLNWEQWSQTLLVCLVGDGGQTGECPGLIVSAQ